MVLLIARAQIALRAKPRRLYASFGIGSLFFSRVMRALSRNLLGNSSRAGVKFAAPS
jgi:hypothetical protein